MWVRRLQGLPAKEQSSWAGRPGTPAGMEGLGQGRGGDGGQCGGGVAGDVVLFLTETLPNTTGREQGGQANSSLEERQAVSVEGVTFPSPAG